MVVAMKLASNYEELADKALVPFYGHNNSLHYYKIAFIMKNLQKRFLDASVFGFLKKLKIYNGSDDISYSF
jgi:hypothetical protein